MEGDEEVLRNFNTHLHDHIYLGQTDEIYLEGLNVVRRNDNAYVFSKPLVFINCRTDFEFNGQKIESIEFRDPLSKYLSFSAHSIGRLVISNRDLNSHNLDLEVDIFESNVGEIQISYENLKELHIADCFVEKLVVSSGASGRINLNAVSFGLDTHHANSEIHFYLPNIERIHLNKVTSEKLKIISPSISQFYVTHCSFDTFIFETEITNEFIGEINRLRSWSSNGRFILIGATLKDFKCSNIHFNKFGKVVFSNCSLNGLKTRAIEWSKVIYDTHSQYYEMNHDLFESYEIYRELKMSMITQHDRISELYFRGLEFKVYFRDLPWRGNFWKKLQLGLSYWTNNFGQDYIRAFVWYWCLMFIIFLLMNLASSCLMSTDNFITFINPTHRIAHYNWDCQSPECSLTDTAIWLDFIGRLVGGYLIYQFISAFRKYFK